MLSHVFCGRSLFQHFELYKSFFHQYSFIRVHTEDVSIALCPSVLSIELSINLSVICLRDRVLVLIYLRCLYCKVVEALCTNILTFADIVRVYMFYLLTYLRHCSRSEVNSIVSRFQIYRKVYSFFCKLCGF